LAPGFSARSSSVSLLCAPTAADAKLLLTTTHYPANDLVALDLQDHPEQMAGAGWELISIQQLIKKHSAPTPRMIFFRGKEGEGLGPSK
jgi:hypothetical protein